MEDFHTTERERRGLSLNRRGLLPNREMDFHTTEKDGGLSHNTERDGNFHTTKI